MNKYICECGQKFDSAEGFSNHLTRDENNNVTGCHKKARKPKG